jgi:hypothetical protein
VNSCISEWVLKISLVLFESRSLLKTLAAFDSWVWTAAFRQRRSPCCDTS